MALADLTYEGLKNAVQKWAERSDPSIHVVEDCILMFEAYANRRLRVRQMEGTDTLTTVSGVETLPTDFLTWRSLTQNTSPQIELEYVHPTFLRSAYGTTGAGTPQFFTIEAETITVRPVSDGTTYTLRYWKKIPDLATQGDTGTNWLLTANPDVYLFGALFEFYSKLYDTDKAMFCMQRRDAAMREIEVLSEKSKAPSSIRVMGTIA